MVALAKESAQQYGLDGALICAIVEQESDWNPWAIRYESGFYSHYIEPIIGTNHLTPTEAICRATSWGLMQLMGEVAREYGFVWPFLSQLCEPDVGLNFGCKYFSVLMGRYSNNVTESLLRWNGGGNLEYPDQVQARIQTYSS